MLDLEGNSGCEEWVMVCTDIYSQDRDEDIIVYRDQGVSTEKYEDQTYGVSGAKH